MSSNNHVHQQLRNVVADRIRSAIFDGQYKPGEWMRQERLAQDLGLSDRSVRTHLKSLEANGLLAIQRRGQGKTNIYELNLKPKHR